MSCEIKFNSVSICPKNDTGITLWEVEVRATGTKYGLVNLSVDPADTLLATYDTNSVPDTFTLVDETGGGINDVTGHFSGTFNTSIFIADLINFYQDIKIRFRTTDDCGTTDWKETIILARCVQPSGSINISYIFDSSMLSEDVGFFSILLQADAETEIIYLRIVDAFAVEQGSCSFLVGDSPITGPFISENNWQSVAPFDGRIATYIEEVAITSGDLIGGTWEIIFNKKNWAIDNNLASSVDYDATALMFVKFENTNCSEELNEYFDDLPSKQFAEVFAPFIGKQAALPNSEINFDGNVLVLCPYHGFSLRNGSLNSAISEIRIDLGRTGIIDETINSGNSSIFPLQPLSMNAPTPDGCSGVPTDTPLIFYPAIDYMLANGVIDMSNPADWKLDLLVPFRIFCDYATTYAGLLTTTLEFDIYFDLHSVNSGVSWSEDGDSYFLIARGDANIFANSIQTEISGTTITFGFNVNPTRTGSLGGASSWVIDEIRIADQPGPMPSTYTTYDITDDAFGTPDFPAAPISNSNAYPIGITHNFSAGAGIYKVFIEVETDNGIRAIAETFVVLVTF